MTTSAPGHRAPIYSFRVYVAEVDRVIRSYFNDRDSCGPYLARSFWNSRGQAW